MSHTHREPPRGYLNAWDYDTVNFDRRALALAIEFAGARQVLAGSDYPHLIGSIGEMLESIRGLEIADDEKSAILEGTARELYGVLKT